MEGWNHKLQYLVGHQHPMVWKLINNLQLEQAYTEMVLAQLDVGHVPQQMRMRQVYHQMQLHLQQLCMAFVAGQ